MIFSGNIFFCFPFTLFLGGENLFIFLEILVFQGNFLFVFQKITYFIFTPLFQLIFKFCSQNFLFSFFLHFFCIPNSYSLKWNLLKNIFLFNETKFANLKITIQNKNHQIFFNIMKFFTESRNNKFQPEKEKLSLNFVIDYWFSIWLFSLNSCFLKENPRKITFLELDRRVSLTAMSVPIKTDWEQLLYCTTTMGEKQSWNERNNFQSSHRKRTIWNGISFNMHGNIIFIHFMENTAEKSSSRT